jgi:hypothetical protein
MFLLTDSIPHVNQIFFDTAMLKTPSQRSLLQSGGWIYLDSPSTAGPGQKYAIVATSNTTEVPDDPTVDYSKINSAKLVYPVFFSRPSDADFNPIPSSGLITFINPIIPVEGWVTGESLDPSPAAAFSAGRPVRVKIVDGKPKLTAYTDAEMGNGEKVQSAAIGWALSAVIDGKVKIRYQFI